MLKFEMEKKKKSDVMIDIFTTFIFTIFMSLQGTFLTEYMPKKSYIFGTFLLVMCLPI